MAVLVLLFAMGILSRDMAAYAIYQDEGYVLHLAQEPTLLDVAEVQSYDQHPPLYMLLTHIWLRVVGMNLLMLRLPGVFFTLLAVAVTLRFARELFGWQAGLAAGAVIASSDLVYVLSPMVRQYNLYLLLSVISTWLYWRYYRRWQPFWGTAYTLSGILLVYTLYWGPFILLAHGLHTVVSSPRKLWKMIVPALVIGLVFLPWGLINQRAFTTNSETLSFTVGSQGYSLALSLDKTGMEILLFQLFGIPEALFMGLALAGIARKLSGDHWKDYLPSAKTGIVAFWLGIPILLPLGITLVTGYGLLGHRVLVAMVPAMAVLIGNTLSQFRRWQYALLLAIILVNNVTTTGSLPEYRGPWWEITALFESTAAPQDAVIVESQDFRPFSIEQHLRLAGLPVGPVFRSFHIRNHLRTESQESLEARLATVDAVWLITIEYPTSLDLAPLLAAQGFIPTTPPFEFPGTVVRPVVRYARPPEGEPLVGFEEQIGLMKVQTAQDEDRLSVYLTWQAETQPAADYTLSVFLLNQAGQLVAQHDSFPLNGLSPMSGWTADSIHFDVHHLPISHLLQGEYQLAVKLYQRWDGGILSLDPCSDENCTYFILDSITIR